ncbi:MAG: hypothetical protein FJ125_08605 [Deltaproteobacteria bacterium]|nr:hypothetical protein [Deltaproteobacteria bacterium]
MRSDLPYGVEVAEIAAAPEERAILAVVTGRAGRSVPYALTVELPGADFCPADRYEGPAGNDGPGLAPSVGLGVHPLRLCLGDEDWFSLQVAAGTQLMVTAVSERSVQVALLDGADEGILEEGLQTLTAVLADSGRYLLRFRAEDVPATGLAVQLILTATAAAEAAALACADATPLVPGQPAILPRPLPVQRFALSCRPGVFFSWEYLASFELAQPARVALRIRPEATVALRSGCADPAGELLCVSSSDAALDELDLAAGTWFVLLQDPLGDQYPELLLEVR